MLKKVERAAVVAVNVFLLFEQPRTKRQNVILQARLYGTYRE